MDWKKHVEVADGYLGLNMFEDAQAEIDRIPASDRDHEFVIFTQALVYVQAGLWMSAARLAKRLKEMVPDSPEYLKLWFRAEYKAQEMREKGTLPAVSEKFKAIGAAHYVAACKNCTEGRLNEAKLQLATAYKFDPTLRLTALDEKILNPIWASMCEPDGETEKAA